MAQGFPDMGRKSVIQQTLEQERLAGLRDPEGQAAFKRGVGTGSYFIPGTAQVKAGVGILGKLAPAANQVYRAVTGRKSFKKDFAPVVKAYDSPTANIAGLGFVGMTAPDVAAEIPEALEKNQVGRALANTGFLGLESLALPSFLKKSSKAKFLPVGVGNLINKSGDMVGKVTRPGKAIVPKVVGIGSSIIGGETLAATLDPDPTLRDQGVKKDDATVKTQTPKSDDDILKAADDAEKNVNTPPLDQQVNANVVNQDLIPATKGTTEIDPRISSTPGDAGPAGTDARSMDMSLVKKVILAEDQERDSKDDPELISNKTNDTINNNNLSLASLRDEMKKTPPSQFFAIKEVIDENFENSESKIQELRNKLKEDEASMKTFDEFRDTFRKNSGYDGNRKLLDYVILQMGLDMMSGKSYQQGLSGFLDILGQAGSTAVEKGMAIAQSEQELNQGLALKFEEYEKDMETYLTEGEKDIINAQLANIQSRDKSTIEALQAQYGAEFDIDKLFFNMLVKKQEAEEGQDLGLEEGEVNIQFANKTFYRGLQNFVGKRQKGSGTMFIEVKGKFVPLTSVFGTDASYNETERDKTLAGKARSQIDYAYNGIKMVQLFKAMNNNLEPGTQGAFGNIISKGIGYEKAIRNIIGLKDDGTQISGTPYADQLKNLSESNVLYGADVESLIIKNTDAGEDRDNFIKSYKDEVKQAENEANKGSSYVRNFYTKLYKGKGNLSDEEKATKVRKALSTYAVIQTKLKYIIANANKAEDRLTQKDIENAAELTDILVFGVDPKVIEDKYDSMLKSLNVKFNENADKLIENGRTDFTIFANKYGDAESVVAYKKQLANLEEQKEIEDPDNSLNILKSIGIL